LNELTLKEFGNKRVIYLYLPEGKGEPGEVEYNIEKQAATVVFRASGDEFGRYGHNAGKKIKEYISRDVLPINAIQAWY